jgi:CBS domain-containing protein
MADHRPFEEMLDEAIEEAAELKKLQAEAELSAGEKKRLVDARKKLKNSELSAELESALRTIVAQALGTDAKKVHEIVVDKRNSAASSDSTENDDDEKTSSSPSSSSSSSHGLASVAYDSAPQAELVADKEWPTLDTLEEHKKAFMSIPIKYVVNVCKPVMFRWDQTPSEALRLLADRNVLSAPFLSESGEVLGFVDVIGLMALVVVGVATANGPADDNDAMPHETLGVLVDRKWLHVQRGPALRVNDSLYRLMQVMARGVHRIPVMDESGEAMIGIATQSDVVSLLARHPILLGFLASKSIEAVAMITPAASIDSVRGDVTAFQAIAHVARTKHAALAVVDSSNHIVASFSANAVKGLHHGVAATLRATVVEFLQSLLPTSAPETPPLFHSCPPSTTVFELVHAVAEIRAHRIWVTTPGSSGKQKLVGLVSLTDLLRSLVSHS